MFKFLLEIVPLIAFFATFKMSDIFTATIIMLIVTAIGLGVSYAIDKKLSMPLLISGAVLFLAGATTIISGDPKYIKIKPTIVFVIFGIILTIGCIRHKGYAKELFGKVIGMSDKAWIVISRRFAIYFFTMATINEIVWRNYSDDFWVNYKIFGFLPLTLFFLLSQVPFIYYNYKKPD